MDYGQQDTGLEGNPPKTAAGLDWQSADPSNTTFKTDHYTAEESRIVLTNHTIFLILMANNSATP